MLISEWDPNAEDDETADSLAPMAPSDISLLDRLQVCLCIWMTVLLYRD